MDDALRHEVGVLLDAWDAGEQPPREDLKRIVKATLAALVDSAPGRSVEVRVPPFAAVQAVGGTTHRRGTPPAVVECDAHTWLTLALGRRPWQAALDDGSVRASGARSDLSSYLPLT
jgi:hypothetical protein